MENKNITINLLIKQMVQSSTLAHNASYLATPVNTDFGLFNKTYANSGAVYASLKKTIENKTCQSPHCELESKALLQMQNAPQESLDFMSDLASNLMLTDEPNFDPNNNSDYTVANCILNKRPGFSITDGYYVALALIEGGGQKIIFSGPAFEQPLVINNLALRGLIDSGQSIVSITPDINADMLRLLTEVGVFSQEMIGENNELKANAKILDEYVIKNPDGSFDYEIIDVGNGKGRNVLKYDLSRIEKRVSPFVNAEVAGMLSSEQSTMAAWNVFISKGTSMEEDDQMVQNANAGEDSWNYETDLPLTQDKKVLFEEKYKQYFMTNYLKQFITNQMPTVQEDAAVFDLAEGKKAKAQKFLDDNNLN